MINRVLVTGGAGYIGSHTVLELVGLGYEVVVLDNFSNSSEVVVERLIELTEGKMIFEEGDINDSNLMFFLFEKYKFNIVIHFAGLKSVAESVKNPLSYYSINVAGTLVLLDVMEKSNCKNLVFSSSATVYGNPVALPLNEEMQRSATNPYGHSKLFVEQILEDLYLSDNEWRIICLRYFNPVGAHESGRIGENPLGKPNNLMPFINQVANGQQPHLVIYGNDYKTPDGTGVRDYIHVVDLAIGHTAALKYLMHADAGVWQAINLGTGKGISVLEMVETYSFVSKRPIPYVIDSRRPGDIDICYADVTKARELLGWEAKRDLIDMCASSWYWQSTNFPHSDK